MFIKRIENKIADIEVSNQISKCSHCGKPVWGMSKIGSIDQDSAASHLCFDCMNSTIENVDDRDTNREHIH